MRDLNTLYRGTPALYQKDCQPDGFAWVANDPAQSTSAFLRFGEGNAQPVLVVCNFIPLARSNLRIGVPAEGAWREVFNSDAAIYGGSNHGNLGEVQGVDTSWDDQPFSVEVSLPPLSTLFFQLE